MMKADVDYKLPKRMKKRRQLDALVDTVKLPRSRKNSTSAQELLDYHSDSSDFEEYSASSIGQNKKKCCFCHSIVVRMGLFMVSMACLTTCVGLVWVQWHIRHELDILRKEIDTVQKADKTSPELIKFQSQLAAMNGTVNSLKTESLESITKDITSMKKELEKLKEDTKKLSQSVEDSSQILDIPNKLQTLQKTVATGMNQLEELQQKVDKLMEPKAPQLPSTPTPGAGSPDVDTQYASMLSDEIFNLNKSMIAQLSDLSKSMDTQAGRITALESSTEAPGNPGSAGTPGLDREAVEALVQDMVHEMVANMSLETSGIAGPQIRQDQYKTLRDQVESIMGDVQKMDASGVQVDFGDYSAFKEDTIANFKGINSSLLTLNSDLDAVSNRINIMGQNLLQVTSALTQGGTSLPNPGTPPEGETPVPPLPAEDDEGNAGSEPHSSPKPTESTIAAETFAQSEGREGVQENTLKIPNVNSIEDLHNSMTNWSLENGEVNLETLNGLLQTPLDEGF